MKPSVKKDFVHLYNHSEYSLPNGMSSIKEMVAKAKKLGMKHLAITDNGTMFGVLHFYRECKANDIIPIIGCSFEVAEGNRKSTHVILLAKNYTGYKNLMLLSSRACTEGFHYKPIIDNEFLTQCSSDLICISPCRSEDTLNNQYNEVQKKAEHFQSIFGSDNFYLELQDHGKPEQKIVNEQLIKLSKETGVALVATNNIHYLDREDAKARNILFSIRTEQKKSGVMLSKFSNGEYYMKSAEEMYDIFRDVPEALANTVKIAKSCKLEIELPGPLLPDYQIPEEYDNPDNYLCFLINEGLVKRYPEITDKINKRIDYELETIINMSFTNHFLIVWDYVSYARKNDIPVGPGRGPSAGSLVAFALRITDIDPIKYGLLFERFLNPERISMPYFSVDFCSERRQEVIDYVTNKYRKDHVSSIIGFSDIKAKHVIGDIAGILNIPEANTDIISELIPHGYKMTIEKAMKINSKLKDFEQKDNKCRQLFDITKRLTGLTKSTENYTAGVVISRNKLNDYVPLYRDKKTDTIATQYTEEFLRDCGLITFYFLELQTLTSIRKIEKLLRKKNPNFSINNIPIDDEAALDIFRKGNTKNIFHFESSGMQEILIQVKPDSLEDLIALSCLHGPGLEKFIPQFIECKNNRKTIIYPDPSLEDALYPTYGVIVYQEQVMEIIRKISGFSFGKADVLRRVMGKKKVKTMNNMKVEFIAGAAQKGYTREKAVDIFEMLVPFACYAFIKSHAAAYTIIAYRCAYLKAHYPEEFRLVYCNVNKPERAHLI